MTSINTKHEDFFTYLNALYKKEGITDLFLSVVHELTQRNYTYSDISTPLNISRTTVSKWVKKEYTPTTLPSDAPPLPPNKPTPYTLSPLEQSNLKTLAQKASKVSRNTPADSPNRKAAEQLLNSILYYQEKHTPIAQIAKAANVSRRSIYQRLEAHDNHNS